MIARLHQFRRWAGVDRAVFFSNAAQMTRLITGPITMGLVLRYLTPEVQGYFYAFSGIVAMQIFLEMGFSQNILQFASHEYGKLRFTNQGTLAGDPVAKSRLISLGRLAFRYYAAAAAIFFLAVGIGGHIFFTISTRHHASANAPIAWQGAWWLVTAAAAGSLVINPASSLLGGCNQLPAIAKFGFWSALASFGVNAVALIMGAGIYVTAIGAFFSLLMSLGYFIFRWRPFFCQFFERPTHGSVSWRHEIWPFQWRIAVSWACGYFIFDIINPIAFYFCGPVDAGRMGMSLQLVRMIFNMAMNWIYTKAPRFGMLISARAWAELDRLWRRSAAQSFIFCLLGMATFWVAVPWVGHWLPRIPARLAPMGVNLWLGGAYIIQVLISSMAMELRAHKREPYMWLAVANAVLSVAFILPLVAWRGIYGEAMGYALAIWVIFLPAWNTYREKRHEFRRLAEASSLNPASALEAGPSSGTIA